MNHDNMTLTNAIIHILFHGIKFNVIILTKIKLKATEIGIKLISHIAIPIKTNVNMI